MTLQTADARLQVVDDDLLADLASEAPAAVTAISVRFDQPYFDLEVISDPQADVPSLRGRNGSRGDDDGSRGELIRAITGRYATLREPFADHPPHLLVVRGAASLDPAPKEERLDPRERPAQRIWEGALDALSARAQELLRVAPEPREEVAAVFDVEARHADDRPPERLAVVAVVGSASASAGEWGGAEQIVGALAGGIARNAPLYVVVAIGEQEPGPAFLARMQRLRASVVLAGSAGGSEVVSLSRTALQPGQSASEVAVVRCPSFKRGTGVPGLTRARLDLVKGQAAIAFRRDLGSDRSPEAVQVVRPLESASRVSPSERRLYAHVRQLLHDAPPDAELEDARQKFRTRVEEAWSDHGYATLCDPEGKVPLTATRHTSYNLLLLLRERNGRYDILLSNHSPLRASPLSDWNTLLLPAFKDARALLEHLRDDVVRQVAERAEDFERAEHARQFEEAVNRILSDDGRPGDELWADQLREVATTRITKISPTTGAVTNFDYHLVTLLPLIDRALAEAVDEEGDPADVAARHDHHRVIEWLSRLETIRCPDDGLGDAPGLPIEAFQSKGAGLRWDPVAALVDEPGADARRRATRAYPGAMWFPLTDREKTPLWRGCPSIAARNEDVMKWVQAEIDKRRKTTPLPDQLLLGRHAATTSGYRVVREFPFESEGEQVDGDSARSTTEALSKVRFLGGFDLEDELAYRGAEFVRVWLVRDTRMVVGEGADAEKRYGIVVIPAASDRTYDADAAAARRPLGMLRPVQRYVLTSGLKRAEEIDRVVSRHLAERGGDPWGFVHVVKGGAPEPVSVTPPIVEQLHPADHDDCSREDLPDYVVCDGNHRIVRKVWKDGGAAPAVAVVGRLPHPYYARPFGRLEWDATADNELAVTPDLVSKYLPRPVKKLKRPLPGVDEKLYYRRYFRNLELGFGPMGGQGGRFV